jgi:hypothetical protein
MDMEQQEVMPLIEIRRDWVHNRWVYVGLGAHSPDIPFEQQRMRN